MDYHFRSIEAKWQQYWAEKKTFKAPNPGEAGSEKPKYYVLDMFPYPSGAGLHVGHPLGYIASDIYSRYKRHKGFNVLHPMGYDSFGLPAEQYAIQTGQHPEITTQANIQRYREQLDKMGLSFDWDREVRTSSPEYYKWTQWIFGELFNAWYDYRLQKARPITDLIKHFEEQGNTNLQAACDEVNPFSAEDWKGKKEQEQQMILMQYRLAYLSEAWVNWCPQLGTVLANDEVKDGVSERGGYPVERKLMKQWSMRISAYAQRLLNGLEELDWSESLKESQRNWIGKSEGCSLTFFTEQKAAIEVFTTRPDTLFGVSFLTLAPEHELVNQITTTAQQAAVNEYVQIAKNRSERERQAEINKVSGVFTGSFVLHPFTGQKIPVYVGDYVLAGYGTGAVMAVPAHDSRDYRFAKHFETELSALLGRSPILEVISGGDVEKEAYEVKSGICVHSDFLNGKEVKAAAQAMIEAIEAKGLGKKKINFRMRDAVFGRQRYWGEPIPVYYKNEIPYLIPLDQMEKLILPKVDKYLPTAEGEPPLARAEKWHWNPEKGEITDAANGYPLETTTMPGWAGSSWYFLRYMDAHNNSRFASKEATDYWQQVDLYVGGSEHATGHLLYVRFWTKALFDLGYIQVDEPAKKLINQGMIQGTSCMVHRVNGSNTIVSAGLKQNYETSTVHIDVNIVDNLVVDIEKLKLWRDDFKDATFILENEKLICSQAVEKMSKRWHNVVNPDDICERYGADTLRLYEMFLGPVELSKPWNTNGISGVNNFLKKLWRLFYQQDQWKITDETPNPAELKTLHKTIKKITEDIERFSFNTSVSNFMIAVNELTDLQCHKREIIEPLLILLSPYAPHITEELWSLLGHQESIANAAFPEFNPAHLEESSFNYPISINGKTRMTISLPATLSQQEIEKEIMSRDEVLKYLNGGTPKRVIVVPKRIVNIVV